MEKGRATRLPFTTREIAEKARATMDIPGWRVVDIRFDPVTNLWALGIADRTGAVMYTCDGDTYWHY